MSPEKNREILILFLSIFNVDWVRAFEILCKIGVADRETVGPVSEQILMLDENDVGIDGQPIDPNKVMDTLKEARAFFKVFWELFMTECANRRLILTKEESLALVKEVIPYDEVWLEIVENNSDFKLFKQMERHDKEADQISAAIAAKEEKRVRILERKQAVRRAIERNFFKSTFKVHPDRLKVHVAEELELVMRELEDEGVPSGPKEMSDMILELYPHIPWEAHLALNHLVPRLQALIDNPHPKLKGTIYGSEKKSRRINISQVEIDHTTGKLEVNKLVFEFSPKGIVDVLTTLRKAEGMSQDEFEVEVNNLLEKIREYCQVNHLSGFKEVVSKLQKKYGEMWFKSDKKSPESLKIGLIYSALGMIHAKFAEDHIAPDKRLDPSLRKG